MTTVVVVDEAERQLHDIVAWWAKHRPAAAGLVATEFERCVGLLAVAPDAGPRFLRAPLPGVRRLVMKRTRHVVYYLHDRANEAVYVIAVWGAPKGGDPILTDPRR